MADNNAEIKTQKTLKDYPKYIIYLLASSLAFGLQNIYKSILFRFSKFYLLTINYYWLFRRTFWLLTSKPEIFIRDIKKIYKW